MVDWCWMCKKSGESIGHLLHCEVARDLLNLLFNLFDVDWIIPRRVRELLMGSGGQVGVVTFWKFGG